MYPRLVVDGQKGPFDGWRARSGASGGTEWVEVAANGTIPIDVQLGNLWLYIEGAGRAWKRGIWSPPGPDPTIHLTLAGPGYAGVVRKTSGEPYRRLRVFATPREGPRDFRLTSSAVTDDEGRFHLPGLEPVPHLLEFHPRASARTREIGPNPLSAVLFEATAPVDDPPVWLELILPERRGLEYPDYETVRFTGQVSNAATGIAEQGAQVDVVSVYPQGGGVLLVHAYTWKTTDERAAYTEEVPRAPRYRATVTLADYALGVMRIEWEDEGTGSEVTRDLVFDPD